MREQLLSLIPLWKTYIGNKKKSIIIGFFTSLMYTLINIIAPFLTRFTIDIVIVAGQITMLVPLFGISMIILIVLTFLGLFTDYILIKAFQNIRKIKDRNLLSL